MTDPNKERDPIRDIARQLGIQTFGDGLLAKIRETIDCLRSQAEACAQYREEMEIVQRQLDRFLSQSHGIPALAEIERLRAALHSCSKASSAAEVGLIVDSVLTATAAQRALAPENQRIVPVEPMLAARHPFDKPSLLKDCNVEYSAGAHMPSILRQRAELLAQIEAAATDQVVRDKLMAMGWRLPGDQPPPGVEITGHLDEIDAPVWSFINEEARKLGPQTGSIDSYNFSRPDGAQPNGVVVALWNGRRLHALAITIRDDMNWTHCVRLIAGSQPAQDAGQIARWKRDSELLDAIQQECWDVRFTSSPNGDAGDSSINIEIIGHFMEKPCERVVGENCTEDLRNALEQAMTADAYPPARPEYGQ